MKNQKNTLKIMQVGTMALTVMIGSGCSALSKQGDHESDTALGKQYNFGYQVFSVLTEDRIKAQAFDDGSNTYVVPLLGNEFTRARTTDGQSRQSRREGSYFVIQGVGASLILSSANGDAFCVSQSGISSCQKVETQQPIYPIQPQVKNNPVSQIAPEPAPASQAADVASVRHGVSMATTKSGVVLTASRIMDENGRMLPPPQLIHADMNRLEQDAKMVEKPVNATSTEFAAEKSSSVRDGAKVDVENTSNESHTKPEIAPIQSNYISVSVTPSGETVKASRMIEQPTRDEPEPDEKPFEFKALFIDGSEKNEKERPKLQKAGYSAPTPRKQPKAVEQAKKPLTPQQREEVKRQVVFLNQKLMELTQKLGEFDEI